MIARSTESDPRERSNTPSCTACYARKSILRKPIGDSTQSSLSSSALRLCHPGLRTCFQSCTQVARCSATLSMTLAHRTCPFASVRERAFLPPTDRAWAGHHAMPGCCHPCFPNRRVFRLCIGAVRPLLNPLKNSPPPGPAKRRSMDLELRHRSSIQRCTPAQILSTSHLPIHHVQIRHGA